MALAIAQLRAYGNRPGVGQAKSALFAPSLSLYGLLSALPSRVLFGRWRLPVRV
jgi:hypothetical protein